MKVAASAALCVLAVAVTLTARSVEAQPARARPTVAVILSNTPLTDLAAPQPKDRYASAFLAAMRELGWIDGQNVTILWRSAEGHPERYAVLSQELVKLNVDLIVASGAVGLSLTKATSTIPIVMVSGGNDPGWGVQSIVRPGGNVTGLTTTADPAAFAEKQLQLLKEAAPRISRVAYLSDIGTAAAPEAAARVLRLTLIPAPVDGPNGLSKALDALARQKADAIFVAYGRFFWAQRGEIIQFAARHRLPAMYPFDVFARDGGLMSYGADFVYLFRRAAIYVDKILKGARAADLPVERPLKFELVVNLKTSKALGLQMPPAILVRADQTIE